MRARSAESLSVYVRQRAFRRTVRGYDPEEVDRHLETISKMIASGALGELAREQESHLGDREAAVESAESRARQLSADAERLIAEARVEAEATIKGAELKAAALRAEAEELVREARLRAEASSVITGARAEAAELIAAARAEADRVVFAARAEAQRLADAAVGQARAAAQAEAARTRAQAEEELSTYVARRKREADRLVEGARANRRR